MASRNLKNSGRRKAGSSGGSAGSSAEGQDAAIANLEPVSTRTQLFSLQQLLTNKQNPKTRDAAKLGDVLIPWFETVVTKPAGKLEALQPILEKLLPAAMLPRIRVLSLSRGTLAISLPSAPLRAQFDGLLRAGLLREIQTQSKGLVYRIKTSVDAAD